MKKSIFSLTIGFYWFYQQCRPGQKEKMQVSIIPVPFSLSVNLDIFNLKFQDLRSYIQANNNDELAQNAALFSSQLPG